MSNQSVLSHLMITLLFIIASVAAAASKTHAATDLGTWQLLQPSVGVSAMHMQLLNNDRVILFDRTNFGKSNISLPDGKCRVNIDKVLKRDCTAHSIEYNVVTNTFRPLMILTDTWCSSGAITPSGRLEQTGGWSDGEQGVRIFTPCSSSCDWDELGNKLLRPRWYASNHILPNGQVIIIGGLREFNYEFYPKTSNTDGVYQLPFLQETSDDIGSNNTIDPLVIVNPDNNLYPYVFLNPADGNLFIFANNRAILLNYKTHKVVRYYPTIPDGGHPRCWPSSGSAVLLPLTNIDDKKPVQAEVLVCGGSPKGSFQQASSSSRFLPALNTCARMTITDQNPKWTLETMPMPRVMGDMILLPNGHVLIINGVERGTQGWELGRDPVLNPVIYDPNGEFGSRFEVQAPSKIPRVYHSTAILVRDGRVMVGGGNAHQGYEFGPDVLFPTELSLEAFSPSYLGPSAVKLRPMIVSPENSHLTVKYKQTLCLEFSINEGEGSIVKVNQVKVTMVLPSFNTHSFSQGQRLLELTQVGKVVAISKSIHQITVKMPCSAVLAPPVYYMLFVVHQGVPSEGKWVKIGDY